MVQLAAIGEVQHGDVVTADYQTNGKGQRGNSWQSERGQNLLFSLFVTSQRLQIEETYLLTLTAGLAIAELVEELTQSPYVKLKWPNDVYVKDRKIAGILIETSLKKQLEYAIIGIGLNVNQSHFSISTATSLKMESDKSFGRSEVLQRLLEIYDEFFLLLEDEKISLILARYHDRLYWRGEKRIYKALDEEFEAELIGIDRQGNLVLNRDGKLKHFRTKEVTFVS